MKNIHALVCVFDEGLETLAVNLIRLSRKLMVVDAVNQVRRHLFDIVSGPPD
jgi:hypothetical protein